MKRLIGAFVGVISFGLGVAALTPPAYGHGGNTSLIHGCLNQQSRNLRIIAANGTCKPNETPLDWNSVPDGLAVKDSLGEVIGKFLMFGAGGAIRVVNGEPVLLQMSSTGFRINGVTYQYTTSDCTGIRYLYSWRSRFDVLFELADTTDGQTFYFAAFPAQSLPISSTEYIGPGGDASGVGICQAKSPELTSVGAVSTVSVGPFVAPFYLE